MSAISFTDPGSPESPGIALAKWQGFGMLRPAEPSASSVPVHELVEGSDSTWHYRLPWRKPHSIVPALGCHFLTDIALWQPGVATHQGHFINDNSISAHVALTYIEGKTATFTNPSLPRRDIDRPALLIGGPGYLIWGHWLVEFLPTVAIARETLGPTFDDCVIPLPQDTPDWVVELLAHTCGVKPESIIRYHPHSEYLHLAKAVRPTFSFAGEYTFHSFTRTFYEGLRVKTNGPRKRLCVSRGNAPYADARPFPKRSKFEAFARERGFDIVHPETLSLPDQIALFGRAEMVIGEYGSGMHSTVFCNTDTIVGCVGRWNAAQMRLGELFHHQGVYLTRGCSPPGESRALRLDVTEDDLASFVNRVVSLCR
jgi:hypothetical protein